MARPRRLTVCVSSRVQLDSVSPWIKGLRDADFEPYLLAPASVLGAAAKSDPGFSGAEVAPTAPLRAQLTSRLHSMVTSLLTPPLFSPYYTRAVGRSRLGAIRHRLSRLLGELQSSADSANRLAATTARIFDSPRLVGDALLVVSVCSFPHLVATTTVPTMTLMESWDHPRSRPAGYRTDVVAGWNRQLTEDWIRFQGAEAGVVGFPTKLRYAIESPVGNPEAGSPQAPLTHNRVMYAATSSANTPHGWLFSEELRIVDALAEATASLGLDLLIKPKPNGRTGEFDAAAKLHSNVSLGRYGHASGPVDYVLNESYNRYRLEEMASVDAVINIGSTYALDAAAAAVPVLQLDFRSRGDFPDFARAQHSWHLAQYLLARPGTLPIESGSLPGALARALTEGLGLGRTYMINLRKWLVPKGGFSDAISRVASALDNMVR